MKRIKLIIAYEGTNYCGWQIQPNAITVQEVIEKCLHTLFNREIELIGASRTDSGVHALGQVAVFDVDTTIPPEKIAYALNSMLPDDIIIQGSEEVPVEFHPRYDAKKKTYEYRILNTGFNNPLLRNSTYFIPKRLDISKMKEAAEHLLGENDFKSFCSINTSVSSTVRTVYNLDVIEENSIVTIRITGNGFLYNMVRIIAGTLINVGLGRIEPIQVKHILDTRDRANAGPTAPAKGLMLIETQYM